MKILYIIIGLFYAYNLMGQKFDYKPSQVKEITINYDDSIAIVSVYSVEKDIKTKNNIKYFWYYSNRVHYNIGGYQGRLLHGKYIVLNLKNNLITKGYLKNGVKDGVWKHWYPNGVLKEVNNYKDGLREGKHIVNNQLGEKIVEENYKSGLLHGSCFYVVNDKNMKNNYKNGKLLINKKRENSTKKGVPKINQLFQNREVKTDIIDSSDVEENNSVTDNSTITSNKEPEKRKGRIRLLIEKKRAQKCENKESSNKKKNQVEIKPETESNSTEPPKTRLKISAGKNSIQKTVKK